jgi:squalene-associated FAD-dependent desaturase
MTSDPLRVAIIGGGLAGLAAAVALSGRGLHIALFEAKRRLGGRAGSYLDRESGELIDHCQHVAMGCCTNYLDFCQRTGIADLFDRHKTLYFFGPDGRRSDFRPSRWLPAPLHLLPALVGLKHLTFGDKLAIARATLRLIRTPKGSGVLGGNSLEKKGSVSPPKTPDPLSSDPVVLDWLHKQRQPERAIERFWQVVLVSALGESLDRASLAAARKVFLDGFIAHPGACHVLVPKVPLGELYDVRVAHWLQARGVAIRLESPVEQILGDAEDNAVGIRLDGGKELPFDHVILAVPWRRAADLLSASLLDRAPLLAQARLLASAPITGVHLWLDRPITDLPHAVLVGRLSQWVFRRTDLQSVVTGRIANPSYYQVVISASHDLAGREREAIRDEVLDDLRAIFPAAGAANLLRWQMITEQEAVFSYRPGLDEVRPRQTTPVPNLVLAGDWTRTGWPATMEGAVRSGYLAAEAILARIGRPERILVPDLPRGWLVKALGARGWPVGGRAGEAPAEPKREMPDHKP